MSETPLANDASARDSAGTIVDQAQSGTDAPKTETSTETTTPIKAEQVEQTTSTDKPKEGETLLTSDDKKPDADAKAPEKYADFKLPEGITLQPETLEKATGLFKELGLTQDQAQKLIDLDIERTKAAGDPMKPYNDMRADWQAKTKADPDIAKVRAGDKAGLDAVKINVAKVYGAIGDVGLVNQFKEAMNLSGVGDHPAFVRVMNKLSEFVVEGKHVQGSGPSAHGQSAGGTQVKPSAAQAMYPNLPSSARS